MDNLHNTGKVTKYIKAIQDTSSDAQKTKL